MRTTKFDDIRPYFDEEIPDALRRITESDAFPMISKYAFPKKSVDEVRDILLSIKGADEFQQRIMQYVIREILRKSSTEFTWNGLEKLERGKSYLFVSNHRDIMLDAAVLQVILVENGMKGSEITFGANLMQGQLIIDIGKSNKMFRVERPGVGIDSARQFYLSSCHLSEYIRYAITEKKESVWIAQRNGRTKDGNDTTDQGVVKMFGMSYPEDKVEALDSLHIVPLAISYEWEPCDIMKVLELYETSKRAYIKKPGEDLNSILQGITAQKGRVHLEFCDPIRREELLQFDYLTGNRYNKEVASLLDDRIRHAYKLFPTNYIAHDIRYGHNTYSDKYTPKEKEAFLKRMGQLVKYEEYDIETMKDIFLGIYSNPVDNK